MKMKKVTDMLIDEAVMELEGLMRTIRCDPNAFEFANVLFENRFRGAVKRILHLKNLAEGCFEEGDSAQADKYLGQATEVERQFYGYLKHACLILSHSPSKADEIVQDADQILPDLINKLRLMGQ